MKIVKYIYRFLLFGTELTLLPYWIAKSYDLHIFAFIFTFDFVLLMILAGALDCANGRKPSRKNKILFPQPFDDFYNKTR